MRLLQMLSILVLVFACCSDLIRRGLFMAARVETLKNWLTLVNLICCTKRCGVLGDYMCPQILKGSEGIVMRTLVYLTCCWHECIVGNQLVLLKTFFLSLKESTVRQFGYLHGNWPSADMTSGRGSLCAAALPNAAFGSGIQETISEPRSSSGRKRV